MVASFQLFCLKPSEYLYKYKKPLYISQTLNM